MKTEPAMIMAILQSALALAISFGLHLTAEQVGGIVALSAAVFGLITRSKVSPVGKSDK